MGEYLAVGEAPSLLLKEDFYMKKLIVLLMAVAMVAAVSAQVTTAVSLYGEVTVIDQDGNSVFTRYGNGYDLWTLKASDKDGKYGFSITDQNILDDSGLVVRDWNFWWKGQYTKVILGKLRNADFRYTLPYWSGDTLFGGTDRITGYGVLIEAPFKNGMTLGVNLPIGETATSTWTVVKKADLGFKYNIKDFGGIFALMNFEIPTNASILNAGFNYNASKCFNLVGITKMQFGAADTYQAALGAKYTGVKDLTVWAEGAYKYAAGVNSYSLWAQADYGLTDKLTATVGGAVKTGGHNVYTKLGYDYGNGLSSEVGFGHDTAFYAAAKLYYSVSF